MISSINFGKGTPLSTSEQRVLLCALLLLGGCPDGGGSNVVGPILESAGEPIGQPVGAQNEVHEAKEIIGGYAHACVHLVDDRAKCWGLNDKGQCNLKTARNVGRTRYDLSNAHFSKLVADAPFTCGIVKDEPYKGIPFCFGEEGAWLDVPNEPILDISAGSFFVCFIKANGRIGCEGTSQVRILSRDAHGKGQSKEINARDLVKYGIDPVSKKCNQDFSNKKFKSVKVGTNKVCAEGADDGIIYCMGSDIRNSGYTPTLAVADYSTGDENTTFVLMNDGSLVHIGSKLRFFENKNLPDPYVLKYKKFLPHRISVLLLTTAGNVYADGRAIPENTLITTHGMIEEGAIGAASLKSSLTKDRFSVVCILKDNHKVKCVLPPGGRGNTDNALFTDIPPEISY